MINCKVQTVPQNIFIWKCFCIFGTMVQYFRLAAGWAVGGLEWAFGVITHFNLLIAPLTAEKVLDLSQPEA